MKEKRELEEPGPGIAMQSDGLMQPENMACIWGAKMVTQLLLEECQQLLEARKAPLGLQKAMKSCWHLGLSSVRF